MWRFFDERARRLGILDTKLAQGAAMFVALVIVKLEPRIMGLDAGWYAAAAAVFAVRPLITFFGRGDAAS